MMLLPEPPHAIWLCTEPVVNLAGIAASARFRRSASFMASLLYSAVYLLFVCGVCFLPIDHLWSESTQFLRCPILVEGITDEMYDLNRHQHQEPKAVIEGWA